MSGEKIAKHIEYGGHIGLAAVEDMHRHTDMFRAGGSPGTLMIGCRCAESTHIFALIIASNRLTLDITVCNGSSLNIV